MSDYSDKSFKELYSEVVEYVKTLTTKWDPTVADEADPGVAILKANCLLFDKINYRQNYRNAQNSVREVSDPVEGENLFYDLGYHIKKKKSATGNISVKYLNSGSEEKATIPLFTQFSDSGNNITFTSIRKMATIEKGKSGLIEVQEGIPVRYEYLGRRIFTDSDLTSNLRLTISGYSDLASNSIIICSAEESELRGGDELIPIVSDWLNVGDNIFTAVETSNLYSVSKDSTGANYIQFYEDSLKGLSRGIKIWVLSSYGSAGNIPSNRLSQLYSTTESLDTSKFVISHNEFTNGQDQESLTSAMENYYNSYGVNDSLVSARDYSQVIESIIGPSLDRIISKALVSDVSGNHNVVEILSKVEGGGNSLLVRYAVSALVAGILVNALKYSNDYYESFKFLEDSNTLNLIKKALFRKNVLSNEVLLVEKDKSSIFNKYLFDFADVAGTVIVNSTDTEETIKEKVKSVISSAFNSRNIIPGEMISEIKLAEAVKSSVNGIIDCSFYYKNHKILKDISEGNSYLSEDEKVEVVSRSVLKGDLPLFKREDILLPMGAYMARNSLSITSDSGTESTPTDIVEIPQNGKTISKLSGTFNLDSSGSYRLKSNEFIQFYREAKVDSQTYGFGVKPLLLYPQTQLYSEVTYLLEGNSLLSKNSVIATGSVLYSIPGKTYTIEGKDYSGIDSKLIVGESGADPNPPFSYTDNTKKAVKALRNYKVESYMAFSTGERSPSALAIGSVISDGSYLEGKYHYALSLKNGENINLSNYPEAVLRLKTGENATDYVEIKANSTPNTIRLENFSGSLNSNGSIQEPGDWGNGFTSETLVTLIDDETVLELSDKFKYGFITDHVFTEEDDRGYLLGEDEHFIYSDPDLLDFVDFGSGTLIKPLGGKHLYDLKNRVNLDSDLSRQLEDLPFSVRLQNTEIYTFTPNSEDDRIVLSYKKSDLDSSSGGKFNSWFKVPNEGIKVKQGDIEQLFNKGDYTRIGLVLKSGHDKTLQMAKGQKLLIDYKEGGSDSIEIMGGQETYLSMSEPLYLNSATNQDLSQYNLRLKVYGVRLSGNSFNFSGYLSFDQSGGFKYEQVVVEDSTGESYFSMITNGGEYLLKVTNRTNGRLKTSSGYFSNIANGGEGGFNKDSKNSVGVLSKKPYDPNIDNDSTLDPGESGYLYIPKRTGNVDTSGVEFRVSGGVKKGDQVVIESQTQLSGFNPDLFFTDTEDQKASPSEKFEISKGKNLLMKITSLSTGNPTDGNPIISFNFDYVGESQLKSPTEAIKYYDSQHILNKNILTVVNLESLVKNLKIIRRTR